MHEIDKVIAVRRSSLSYVGIVAVVALILACSTHTRRPIQGGTGSGYKRGEGEGMQGFTDGDKPRVAGSRYSVVRDAVFANPYQKVWGAKGNAPLERFPVTFMPLIKGMLPGGGTWQFLAAARRVLATDSDLRWGPDGKGYQRLLHTNAIIMTGRWEITEDTPYSGYFHKGSRGL
ncbi:MAG: hypothetical protein QOE68_2527, partial [Thermoanaerobaculia bacterium]|nr:hypothetical protein [Thermoanaerobaculia bacterium]